MYIIQLIGRLVEIFNDKCILGFSLLTFSHNCYMPENRTKLRMKLLFIKNFIIN